MSASRREVLTRIQARIADRISQSEAYLAEAAADWEKKIILEVLTELEADRVLVEAKLRNEISSEPRS